MKVRVGPVKAVPCLVVQHSQQDVGLTWPLGPVETGQPSIDVNAVDECRSGSRFQPIAGKSALHLACAKVRDPQRPLDPTPARLAL